MSDAILTFKIELATRLTPTIEIHGRVSLHMKEKGPMDLNHSGTILLYRAS